MGKVNNLEDMLADDNLYQPVAVMADHDPAITTLPPEMIREMKAYARTVLGRVGSLGKLSYYLDNRAGSIKNRSMICPNCQGIRGEGRLSAAIGDKKNPSFRLGRVMKKEGNHIDGSPRFVEEMRPDFNQLVYFDCPVCSQGGSVPNLIESSGLSDPFMWHSIPEKMDSQPGREVFEIAVEKLARRWVGGNLRGWLTLIGDNGSGKTTAAMMIGKRLLETGVQVIYITASELSDKVYSAMNSRSASVENLIRYYSECRVLIIDEPELIRRKTHGGEYTVAMEKVVQILMMRDRSNRATIITTLPIWWNVVYLDESNPSPESVIYMPTDDEIITGWKPILSRCTTYDIAATDIGDLRYVYPGGKR